MNKKQSLIARLKTLFLAGADVRRLKFYLGFHEKSETRHLVSYLSNGPQKRRSGSIAAASGYTLIEMLVYMSVAFLILGFAYAAMYKSMDASAGIRRNASDISNVLNAGEHWREDVRHATAPLRVEKISESEAILHIPQHNGEVAYRFTSNAVTRRSGGGDWTPVLEHVKDSDFAADQRQKSLAWRWEVELQPYRKAMTRMRPLFTFIAVPTPPAK